MKAQKPNTSPATVDDAVKCLQLLDHDPTVRFYRGVECFEAGHFEQALPHFLASAEHHCIYAVPYIHEICDKQLVENLSGETIAQRTNVDSWHQHLIGVNVDQHGFFHTSSALANLSKLKTKEQNKNMSSGKKKKGTNNQKSKYQRGLKNFLADASTPHQLYHQAVHHKTSNRPLYFKLLTQAAAHGHLLAIAEFRQCGVEILAANIYTQQLLDPKFHEQTDHVHFADRVFELVVSRKETGGKRALHFAALNLGVAQAVSLVASIYYYKHNHYRDAFMLASLGCLRNDGQALSVLINSRCALHNIVPGNKHFEIEAIIATLIKNMNKEYDDKKFQYCTIADYDQFIQLVNLQALIKLFNEFKTLPIFFNNDELLEILKSTCDQHDQKRIVAGLKVIVADIHMKRIAVCKEKSEQLPLFSLPLRYLREAYSELKDINLLLTSFYLAVEYYQTERDTLQESKAETIQRLRGIVITALIIKKWVETIKDPNEYSADTIIKYSKYSINALRYLFELAPEYEQTYQSEFQFFTELGETVKHPPSIIAKACYHTYGNYGYEQNHLKALELLQSIPQEANNPDLVQLQVICYISSEQLDSQQGIRLLEQKSSDIPALLLVLAELHDDGYLGIPQDRKKAEHYYHQAVQAGIMEGHVGLGLMAKSRSIQESNELAAQKHIAQMRKHFEQAYDSGSSDAAFFLGKMFLVGKEVTQDLGKARTYFDNAVSRSNHPHAKAYLAMLNAGYKGEQQFDGHFELIRLQTLKDCGNLKQDPYSMFDYGLLLLATDPISALEYLQKAALYNNTDAQYLLAAVQCLVDHPETNFSPEIVRLINQKKYQVLFAEQKEPELYSHVKYVFDFSKLMKQYLSMNFPIPFEFVVNVFTDVAVGKLIELTQIKKHIKERYPSEKEINRQKTIMLASKLASKSKPGDQECRIATEQLFAHQKDPHAALARKLQQASQSTTMSMKDLSNCIVAFLKTGIKLTDKKKKALKAAQNMHPPHGRGDRNLDQPLEGGRQKTAQKAVSAMTSRPK